MRKLLEFILEKLTGSKKFFEIEEEEEAGKYTVKIKVKKDKMGLVIGKEGKTVKAIRDIVRTRGIIEGKKSILLTVEEMG